jgi:hypothetical protein
MFEKHLKENKTTKKRTKETTYLNLCKKFKDSGIPISLSFENPQDAIFKLHLGKKEFYTKEHILDLRICRYFEGKIQRLYGTIEQSTNAFMSVLYIDLIDSKQVFSKAYKEAFKEKLTEEKFKEIFLFNANSLLKTLQFKPQITPEEAWQKIIEYKNTIE